MHCVIYTGVDYKRSDILAPSLKEEKDWWWGVTRIAVRDIITLAAFQRQLGALKALMRIFLVSVSFTQVAQGGN